MGTRIVEPREEHAPFLAWVSLAAARSHLPRGFWDFFVGGDEAACLRYLEVLATTKTPHLFHASGFLVAEVDGVPAAALCGYFDAELGLAALAATDAEVNARLGRGPEEDAQGMARVAPFLAVVPEHEPGAWIVENVATRPAFRRRGLVRRLLDAMLERGAERGATCAEIGVLVGNDPAQRAYEQAGFRVASEKRSAELESAWGTPGIRLLRRPL